MTADLTTVAARLAELLAKDPDYTFNAIAFALEVRLAMAADNLSLRKLQAQIGIDQASIHRCAMKEKPPSIETYFRLRAWLNARQALTPGASDER